jgi:hypothetical protein
MSFNTGRRHPLLQQQVALSETLGKQGKAGTSAKVENSDVCKSRKAGMAAKVEKQGWLQK